jgi:hypothetical protein
MAAILSMPARKHSTKAKGPGFVRRNCADEASGAARSAGYAGRCAIRLRLVISKSQRTRDTCLLQQVGVSSFLMSRLLDAFVFRIAQTPGFVAASMVLGSIWRWWNGPGVPRGVQEISL